MFDLIWLSIIQGVTEFLPISSSAHLVLYSHFFNFNYDNLSLDISLHLGSLIAIIFYFRKEIVNFISNIKLLFFITLGSLPTLMAGFIMIKFNLIDNLRNIEIIGWTTLIFGIILYLSDLRAENKNIDLMINNKKNHRNIFFKNLYKIGYRYFNQKKSSKFDSKIIKAFQRRYRQNKIDGLIDRECINISYNVANSMKN